MADYTGYEDAPEDFLRKIMNETDEDGHYTKKALLAQEELWNRHHYPDRKKRERSLF